MSRGTWLFVCIALGADGCSGSLFQSKIVPPTVYQLSAVPASAPVGAAGIAHADLPVDLAILKPRVRPGLETDRIAALYPDRRLEYFADARWSGPLDEVLEDLAVQLFRSRADLHNVSGDASAFASSQWLEISVVDFQAEYGSAGGAPSIHVHLIGRMGSSTERRVVSSFEADAQVPAAENRMSAIVDAYVHAADRALEEIAADAVAADRTSHP